MYLLVSEGEHYDFVMGDDHEQQWFIEIKFGDYDGVVLGYSDIEVNGKTGALNYHLEMKSAPSDDVSLKDDDELQLIASSIMQDILQKSIIEKTGRFIDINSGEIIGY